MAKQNTNTQNSNTQKNSQSPNKQISKVDILKKFSDFWDGLSLRQKILLGLVWVTALVVTYRCFLPFRAEWYYREGYNLEAGGQLEAATKSMIKAVNFAPLETFYAVTLGKEYEDLARKETDKQKKFEWANKAYAVYDNIIKISPKNPWYHNRMGELYRLYAELYDDPKVKAEYIASSDAAIIHAAELDKNNGLFQMSLAYLYHRKGQFDKAMELYNKVLEIDPKMSEAYFNMADIWRQRGRTDKTIEMYHSIVSTNPTFQNAHLSLGRIYYTQGKLKAAEEEFIEEIKLNKRNVAAYQSLGALLMQKKEWEMASRVYVRILQIDPQQQVMRQYLAQCYYSMGLLDEAIAELQQVLIAEPSNTQVQRNIELLQQVKSGGKRKSATKVQQPSTATTETAATVNGQ
jgi:tetratricopeptide (TPR) repeat protein